jgi:hypothetical protein
MKVGDAEVLQLLIPNFNLRNIIKESFLDDIGEKTDVNIRVVGLNIVLGDDSADVITLTHLIPDFEKENKIVLDTRNPEHIDLMKEIIEKHQNEG